MNWPELLCQTFDGRSLLPGTVDVMRSQGGGGRFGARGTNALPVICRSAFCTGRVNFVTVMVLRERVWLLDKRTV